VSAAYSMPDTESRFAEWEPSRLSTLDEARKRSRAIKSWRWLFISVAAGAGLAVVASAVWGSFGGDLGFQSEISGREALKMVNPRFTGRSANGASYALNAESAQRRSRASETIDLNKPVFEGALGQTASAPRGTYNEEVRTMELVGGVVFMDKSGNRFDTATAKVDAAADKVVGSGSIRGSGPLGSLRADEYEIKASGGHVYLRGNVRGTIRDSAP
jgi:lipopolysaccharide export system protein LptC